MDGATCAHSAVTRHHGPWDRASSNVDARCYSTLYVERSCCPPHRDVACGRERETPPERERRRAPRACHGACHTTCVCFFVLCVTLLMYLYSSLPAPGSQGSLTRVIFHIKFDLIEGRRGERICFLSRTSRHHNGRGSCHLANANAPREEPNTHTEPLSPHRL